MHLNPGLIFIIVAMLLLGGFTLFAKYYQEKEKRKHKDNKSKLS